MNILNHIPRALPTTNDRKQIDFEKDKAEKLSVNCITFSEDPVIAPKIDKPLSECRVALVQRWEFIPRMIRHSSLQGIHPTVLYRVMSRMMT